MVLSWRPFGVKLAYDVGTIESARATHARRPVFLAEAHPRPRRSRPLKIESNSEALASEQIREGRFLHIE